MTTVAGIDLCCDQTDGRLNLNFSYDNFCSPNQHTYDYIKPAIMPPTHSPRYPQLNSLPARLSTFHQWPLMRPGPQQLAQAGLYYLGYKDKTVCYYCGGGLSSWTPEDNPESEHEKWYPDCELVIRRKKQDVTSSMKPICVSKQNQTLEDPMKSVAVQCLKEFGYTPEKIKKAVDHLLLHNGKRVFSAVELMEVIDNCGDNCGDNKESQKDSSKCLRSNESDKRNATESCSDSPLLLSQISPQQSFIQDKYQRHEDNTKLDANALKQENQRLRDMSICKICMDKSTCIVFLPCGHLVCCADCSPAFRKCPICRVSVRGAVKAFSA